MCLEKKKEEKTRPSLTYQGKRPSTGLTFRGNYKVKFKVSKEIDKCLNLSNLDSWSCRKLWLHLGRGVRSPIAECPSYDTKQFGGEAPVLELWGMWSTPSLPLLPGPLWPGVVAPDRDLSMGQIELFDHLTCAQANDLSNCYLYIAILWTINICANEWVMLNRIIIIK